MDPEKQPHLLRFVCSVHFLQFIPLIDMFPVCCPPGTHPAVVFMPAVIPSLSSHCCFTRTHVEPVVLTDSLPADDGTGGAGA